MAKMTLEEYRKAKENGSLFQQTDNYQTVLDENDNLHEMNVYLNSELNFYKTSFFVLLSAVILSLITAGCILGYKKLVDKVQKYTLQKLENTKEV